jgi:hypothetical protein
MHFTNRKSAPLLFSTRPGTRPEVLAKDTVEIAHQSAAEVFALVVPFITADRPLQSINHLAQQDRPVSGTEFGCRR